MNQEQMAYFFLHAKKYLYQGNKQFLSMFMQMNSTKTLPYSPRRKHIHTKTHTVI